MIIFESILTTFEASAIFWGSWDNSGNQLSLQIKNFNQVKHAKILDMHCSFEASKAGMGKVRPAGHIWPAKHLYVSCEHFLRCLFNI